MADKHSSPHVSHPDPEHPGAQPVAENPNPRANENIRVRSEEPEREAEGIEGEVGSEITDGEDA